MATKACHFSPIDYYVGVRSRVLFNIFGLSIVQVQTHFLLESVLKLCYQKLACQLTLIKNNVYNMVSAFDKPLHIQ